MKFKGKVAIWYWAVCILAEDTMIYSFFVDQEARIFLGISIVFMSLLMLPILFRNYVLIEDNRIYVVFGFFKDSMEIREIREIYRTHNPLASTAASLDRLVIKGRRQEMMCAVCDRETLLQELIKRNPGIMIANSAI